MFRQSSNQFNVGDLVLVNGQVSLGFNVHRGQVDLFNANNNPGRITKVHPINGGINLYEISLSNALQEINAYEVTENKISKRQVRDLESPRSSFSNTGQQVRMRSSLEDRGRMRSSLEDPAVTQQAINVFGNTGKSMPVYAQASNPSRGPRVTVASQQPRQPQHQPPQTSRLGNMGLGYQVGLGYQEKYLKYKKKYRDLKNKLN